jgi:hypothetical protein
LEWARNDKTVIDGRSKKGTEEMEVIRYDRRSAGSGRQDMADSSTGLAIG